MHSYTYTLLGRFGVKTNFWTFVVNRDDTFFSITSETNLDVPSEIIEFRKPTIFPEDFVEANVAV